MLRCEKGKWVHVNRLVLDDGRILYVIPYGIMIDQYAPALPLDVFMQLDERNFIKNVVVYSELEV